MKLELIQDYLVEQAIGSPVFVGHMPEKIRVGILLINNLSGTKIDPYLPGYYKTGFQLIVRHQDYTLGMTLATSAMNTLTLRQKPMPGVMFHYVQPKHEPVAFPISKGDNLEISVNFDVAYVVTT